MAGAAQPSAARENAIPAPTPAVPARRRRTGNVRPESLYDQEADPARDGQEQDAGSGRPSDHRQPQKTSGGKPCWQRPPTALLHRSKTEQRKAHAADQSEHGDVLGVAPPGNHHRGRIESYNPAGHPRRGAAAQNLMGHAAATSTQATSKATAFALQVVSDSPKARKNGIRQ